MLRIMSLVLAGFISVAANAAPPTISQWRAQKDFLRLDFPSSEVDPEAFQRKKHWR